MTTPPPPRQVTHAFPAQQPVCELAYDLDPELLSPVTEWVDEQGIPASAVAVLRFSQFVEDDQDWDHHFAYISTVDKRPTLDHLLQFEAIDLNLSLPEERQSLGFTGIFYRWVRVNWPVYYRL